MLSKHPKKIFSIKKTHSLKNKNHTGRQQSNTGPACLYICRNVCWLTSYKLNRRNKYLVFHSIRIYRTEQSHDEAIKNWLWLLGEKWTDVIPSVGGFCNWYSVITDKNLIWKFKSTLENWFQDKKKKATTKRLWRNCRIGFDFNFAFTITKICFWYHIYE